MNATSIDIKDILVSEGSFVFGTDLFIGTQPPEPVNCVTIFDTSNSPADGTIDGDNVFFQESLLLWIRNSSYEAANLQAQAIIGLLHNRAGFTQNDTFYLYCNLQSGPNGIAGDDEENYTVSLNFNLQRKSGIVPAAEFLTFVKLVQALVAGENITLSVNEEAETITITAEENLPIIYMRSNGTFIQYSNDNVDWINVIALADITGEQGEQGEQGIPGVNGADGREVEFQKSVTHIQWRYVGDSEWIDLVALADLKGEQGIPGTSGVTVIQDADDVDKTDMATGRTLVYNEVTEKHEYKTNLQKLTATITIAVADWSGGLTCTKAVAGLLATDSIRREMDRTNALLYGAAVITGDSSVDGQITFTCTTTPTSEIVIPLTILR